jgi:hypothetical protein
VKKYLKFWGIVFLQHKRTSSQKNIFVLRGNGYMLKKISRQKSGQEFMANEATAARIHRKSNPKFASTQSQNINGMKQFKQMEILTSPNI